MWQFPKVALRHFSTRAILYQSDRYFYLVIPGLGRASLEYRYNPRLNCLAILHTNVPDHMKGFSIGKILAQEALDYTVSRNYNLRVECDFVKYYISKYAPEYNKIRRC